MVITPWNKPFHKVNPLGVIDGFQVSGNASRAGRAVIGCFIEVTWDSVAVGGILGQTYDATNHITTLLQFVNPPTLYDNFGIRYAEQWICFDGSSGANVSNVGAIKTGKCALELDESIQAFRLFVVGNSGAVDNLVPAAYLEADNTIAGILAPLRFSGLLLGY